MLAMQATVLLKNDGAVGLSSIAVFGDNTTCLGEGGTSCRRPAVQLTRAFVGGIHLLPLNCSPLRRWRQRRRQGAIIVTPLEGILAASSTGAPRPPSSPCFSTTRTSTSPASSAASLRPALRTAAHSATLTLCNADTPSLSTQGRRVRGQRRAPPPRRAAGSSRLRRGAACTRA